MPLGSSGHQIHVLYDPADEIITTELVSNSVYDTIATVWYFNRSRLWFRLVVVFDIPANISLHVRSSLQRIFVIVTVSNVTIVTETVMANKQHHA